MFEKLVLADSLLDVNSVDSAQQILSQIQQSKFIDEEQGAYCNLLATRLAYVKYEPNISLSPLNSSIAYFFKKRDKEKLARGYFYKGVILYEQGKRKEAIVCYKKCEKLAETLKDEPTLKSKACLKCLYFTIIIFDLCRYLEYFSYLYTIN